VKAKPNVYVLDSFALLAYLQTEPGGLRVKAVLAQAERKQAQAYLSIISYGEVVYITEREQGLPAAHKLIAAVDQLPITVAEADRKLVFAAAHLKAHYPISYADAFVVALAQQEQAILLTATRNSARSSI
jgi:predicted nucleic acid-binding protein